MSDARLKSIYSRWLRLEEAKQEISDDLKELFKEAKGDGYDGKAIRAAFRKVAKLEGDKAEEIREQDALVDLYIDALTRDAREAASYAEATGREPVNREDRRKQRTSEAMDDAKALSAEAAALGLIDPEAHAETARIADAIARKYGAGVIDPTADDDVPAFIKRDRKPLRPNCLNPDLCAGSGRDHCHACKKAMAESEAA